MPLSRKIAVAACSAAKSVLKGMLFVGSLLPLLACVEAPTEQNLSVLHDRVASDKFDPPKSGELKPQQIQMFLEIKRRQMQLMESVSSPPQHEASHPQNSPLTTNSAVRGMLAGLALDVKAAVSLGYNTAEYEWVAGKLRTAQTLGPMMIHADREDVALMMDVIDTLVFKLETVNDAKLRGDYTKALKMIRAQVKSSTERRGRFFESYPGISHNFMLYRQHAAEIDEFQL